VPSRIKNEKRALNHHPSNLQVVSIPREAREKIEGRDRKNFRSSSGFKKPGEKVKAWKEDVHSTKEEGGKQKSLRGKSLLEGAVKCDEEESMFKKTTHTFFTYQKERRTRNCEFPLKPMLNKAHRAMGPKEGGGICSQQVWGGCNGGVGSSSRDRITS